MEMAVFVEFVEAHGATIVGDKEAVDAIAVTIQADDGATGGEVEDSTMGGHGEEIRPFSVRMIEEPIRKELLTGEAVGVEDIDFFVAITVKITGGDTDGLTTGIGEREGSDDFEAGSRPLEDGVGEAVARDEPFKITITIDIKDGDTIIKLSRIAADEITAIDEHRFIVVMIEQQVNRESLADSGARVERKKRNGQANKWAQQIVIRQGKRAGRMEGKAVIIGRLARIMKEDN